MKENRDNYESQSDGQNISSPPMPIDESEDSAECRPDYQNVMNDLGLEVLGEDESGGIILYSKSSRKKTSLRNVAQLKMEKLVQICGPACRNVIEDIGIEGIKIAVAESAYSARRLSAESERRQGIWETSEGNIAVVGADCFGKWDGKTFHQVAAKKRTAATSSKFSDLPKDLSPTKTKSPARQGFFC